MLSNITVDGRAPLQTVLLGQPQFRRMLASPHLDQLRQRVIASYHLGPLSAEETQSYIEYRLKAVGWAGSPVWQEAAFGAVHRHTGGIPRRVNRLCARVLLYGALEESQEITTEMVERTAEELRHDLEGAAADWNETAAPASPAPSMAMVDAGLLRRIEALEDRVARRERAFQRLAEVLASSSAAE